MYLKLRSRPTPGGHDDRTLERGPAGDPAHRAPVDALHPDAPDTDHEVPVIVRGEGAYVYDQHGKRYLDGLAGLFTSQHAN